jgi:SAM-dependent methyltransferase
MSGEPDTDVQDLVAAILAGAARRDPPHVVLMHLLGASPSEAAGRQALAEARRRCPSGAADRIDAIASAWDARPQAWATVRDVLAVALDPQDRPQDSLARWRSAFDRIAGRHPEGGVALYALGDPALLAAASRDVIHFLQGVGDLRPGHTVLDLGCGIGRLSGLLVDAGASVLGVDISLGMLVEARRRQADGRVLFAQLPGSGLDALAGGAFDMVVAADVFPYLVDAGEAVAASHLADLARVLKPGGRLCVANLSYRGDEARDAADLGAWSTAAGLRMIAPPHRPFSLWDGVVARLEKPV